MSVGGKNVLAEEYFCDARMICSVLEHCQGFDLKENILVTILLQFIKDD